MSQAISTAALAPDTAQTTDRIKRLIVDSLHLEGVRPESIDDDAPLFGEGLGLDSIDSLELVVLMDRNYGIKLKDPKEGRHIFYNIRTMAEYIHANRKQA